MGRAVAVMKPRRVLFWAHLSVGVAAGVVILIMCLTGIGLAFERQIVRAADRASRAPVIRGSVYLPIEALLAKLPSGAEGLSAITVSADREEPVAFAFGRERTVYLDPYSGRYLGQGSSSTRAFFSALERWHRAIGSELRGHGPGRPIADAANLLFLLLVVSGLFLWWPRIWSVRRLRSITLLRRSSSLKAALWNAHNVIGIWCAIPLFVVVFSGVIMSYAWANNLLFRISGSPAPLSGNNRPTETHQRHSRQKETGPPTVSVGELFGRAGKQVSGWHTITLRWAPDRTEYVFAIDNGNGGQPQLRSQLTLNARDGSVKAWEPFSSYSTGRRWRSWTRFLHTGEALGPVGQILAALATLGGALLVITGFGMAWLRFRARWSAERINKVSAESSFVPNR